MNVDFSIQTLKLCVRSCIHAFIAFLLFFFNKANNDVGVVQHRKRHNLCSLEFILKTYFKY